MADMPEIITCTRSCTRKQRCPGCAPSDSALADMRAAVEARMGRVMTPDRIDALFTEASRIRCATQATRVHLETHRNFREALPSARACKAAMEKARKIISEVAGLSSDERLAAIKPIDRTLGIINAAISCAEGKILSELISLACGVEETTKPNPRSKYHLNVLVLQGMDYWLHITGDKLKSVAIGHPDRPGPFLKFLGALADGVPGGITMNSLYDKARQIAGRRG